MIRLYNTLSQKLEDFTPRVPGKVHLYLCGLTTYDLAHAGHARNNVAFDTLVRHMRERGLDVVFVRNVTDVDDKIVNRAKENGEDPLALSARMSLIADQDLAEIGVQKPTVEPRVSTHMDEIIALIQRLIEKDHAYVAKTDVGNDVYFHVRSFPGYGKLSRRNIDDLLSGARVEVGETKKDPLDFALWKGCEETGFGWPSPWGKGRPGWHIECSAMAQKHLGDEIDVHCGGMDLIFPHHENEIAQSEAATGKQFSRYWLHNGFLNVDSEKMSKSLGNFVTIRDVLDRNDAEGFRYFLLGTHYRGPLSFDVEKDEASGRVRFPNVDEGERRAEYLYLTRDALAEVGGEATPSLDAPKELEAQAKVIDGAHERVLDALDRDLNTPVALSVLAEVAKAGNEIATQALKLRKNPAAFEKARGVAAAARNALMRCVHPLGLMQAPSADFFARCKERRLKIRGLSASDIDRKLEARTAARAAKDFAKADEIRKELESLGVDVLDSAGGSSWRVKI
jgi:cysteinyl-tRNA synthetase